MMGNKHNPLQFNLASSWHKWQSTIIVTALLTVWFASSILSTLINKVLMQHFPYPVTISAIHMLSSVIVDLFIILSRGLSLSPFRWDVFWQCLPVAATINFGKTLTYVSYGMVPASLTHTAKASSPIFSVLLTKLMYNKWPSMATCLALFPLTLGVILSALTEINLVMIGFLAAVAAALANVLNSIYTKRAISHVSCPDPIIFHMYTAATATLILAPYALFKDSHDFFAARADAAEEALRTNIIIPSNAAVAAKLILMSVSLHYLQNISSIYFLAQVSVLSHQVAQSLKRLVVIACSVIYFHTPVTAMNVVGMTLALLGFFAYSLAKQQQNSQSGTGAMIRSQPPTPQHARSNMRSNSDATGNHLHPHNGVDHDHVIDSYAMVRASELGSSHLLQSPASGSMVRVINVSQSAGSSPSHANSQHHHNVRRRDPNAGSTSSDENFTLDDDNDRESTSLLGHHSQRDHARSTSIGGMGIV